MNLTTPVLPAPEPAPDDVNVLAILDEQIVGALRIARDRLRLEENDAARHARSLAECESRAARFRREIAGLEAVRARVGEL